MVSRFISRLAISLGVTAGLVFISYASDGPGPKSETTPVITGGYCFWQFGQIVKGFAGEKIIAHQWMNNALIGLRTEAFPSDRLHIIVSPEFKLNYPFPEAENKPQTVRPFGVAYINEAYGDFTFGIPEKPYLKIALGMFNYKYNPEVRNLGEFLYRTGTFPAYIVTDFDYAKARLLGLKVSTGAIDNLKADLILSSEAFMYPLYDFSLAGVASYSFLKSIVIGGGFDFARLFPAVSNKTSPKNTKFDFPNGYNEYISMKGDTAFYSFKALKVMGRISVDPKVFFGSPEIFGKEDLKVYGEIAVIGLDRDLAGIKAKNLPLEGYPDYYSDLSRRMPMMAGINIPTFKVLDVIAAEIEYFPVMYPNDYYLVVNLQSPIPNIAAGSGSYRPENYRNGSVRWSCFLKKEVIKGFNIIGQVAFDHLRTNYWDGSRETAECVVQKGDWHWELKTGYNF